MEIKKKEFQANKLGILLINAVYTCLYFIILGIQENVMKLCLNGFEWSISLMLRFHGISVKDCCKLYKCGC